MGEQRRPPLIIQELLLMTMTEKALKEKGKTDICETKKPPRNTDEDFDKQGKKKKKQDDKEGAKQIKKEIEKRVIEELNKKHAVVHTDRFYILTEKPDPNFGGINFTLESKQSFKDTYENQTVEFGTGKTSTKTNIWLKSPQRRQYNGIVFQPNLEVEDIRYYNIWKGFSVKPKKGCCEKYKAHTKNIVCGGNVKHYDYLWKWCAKLMRKPHELAETAPLLLGDPGTGKNTFVNALGKILGGHYLPLDNIDQLLGKFNFHLKNAVLIHGNEALWGGHRREIGKLKAAITERYKVIEGKGKDLIVVPNFTHLIISSNEDWPVHIDRGDRRFFVLEVSDTHKEDFPYFKAIDDELKNGGYEALLYELLNEDISDFDPRRMPHNIAAFAIKLLSANTCERYIFEAIKAGSFDIGNATQTELWKLEKSKNSVFVDYQCWCSKEGIKSLSSDLLGRAINKLIPSINSTRPSIDGQRVQTYAFPEHTTAKKEFQKAYKADSSIWE